jgi:hypothetical protein
MKKTYIILPIGQHPFNGEYIQQRASEIFEYEVGKKKVEELSKAYPNVKFILFTSVIEMTYIPQVVDFGH